MSIGAAKYFVSTAAVSIYTAFVTPGSLLREDLSPGAQTSNQATANVEGGVGPFTFAWTRVSGDIFTINDPTSDTTTFTAIGSSGEDLSGTYRVTVTDTGNGNAEETGDVSVRFVFAGVPI